MSKKFSEMEKLILRRLINEYKDIIEDKTTSRTSSSKEKKLKAWGDITIKFNNESSVHRNRHSLKKLYMNMKCAARKGVVEENRANSTILKKPQQDDNKDLIKTEGGSSIPKLDEVGSRLLAIMRPQVRALPNPSASNDGADFHDKMDRSSADCQEIPDTEAIVVSPPKHRRKIAPSTSYASAPSSSRPLVAFFPPPPHRSSTITVHPAQNQTDFVKLKLESLRKKEKYLILKRDDEEQNATLQRRVLEDKIKFQTEEHELALKLLKEQGQRDEELHILKVQLLQKQLQNGNQAP